MPKTLLIGQAPNRASTGEILMGRIGQRLATLAGLPLSDYARCFERRNLLDAYPGQAGDHELDGDAFPMADARRAAAQLAAEDGFTAQRSICLGRGVADAFGLAGVAPLGWYPLPGGGSIAWMPHPSGRNRWWNDAANVAAARAFLRAEVELLAEQTPA